MSKEIYGNRLELQLCEKYAALFENSETCKECRKTFHIKKGGDLSVPLSAWMVGNDFCLPEADDTKISKPRILFVGKNAIGDAGGELQGNFRSVFRSSREADWAWNSGRPFWKYTKEIVARVFKDDSQEHIAMTNFVKCNAAAVIKKSSDTTTKAMKDHCILDLKVLRNEIEIIKPNIVIFYTGKTYDQYITGKVNGSNKEGLFDSFQMVTKENATKKIGKRNMTWLAGKGIINGQVMDVLRVGHPQMKKKDEYVEALSNWIINPRRCE